jgi:hypothetical protein
VTYPEGVGLFVLTGTQPQSVHLEKEYNKKAIKQNSSIVILNIFTGSHFHTLKYTCVLARVFEFGNHFYADRLLAQIAYGFHQTATVGPQT